MLQSMRRGGHNRAIEQQPDDYRPSPSNVLYSPGRIKSDY